MLQGVYRVLGGAVIYPQYDGAVGLGPHMGGVTAAQQRVLHPFHTAVMAGLYITLQAVSGGPGALRIGNTADIKARGACLGAQGLYIRLRNRDWHNAGPGAYRAGYR